MMAIYGVVETTNLSGCDTFSFQHTADIENGAIVNKGELVTGERDIYEVKIPSTATLETDPVFLVANPAWNYDTSCALNQNKENYINKAGMAFRCYEMKPNKRFKVSANAIDGNPAVGKYVVAQNGSTKLKLADAAPENNKFVGKIIAVDNTGFPFAIGSAGTANGEWGHTVGGFNQMVLIEVVRN